MADESRIDPVTFETFVNALPARHFGSTHRVMAALTEGLVATVLGLAERSGTDADRRAPVVASSNPSEEEWWTGLHGRVEELKAP